MVACSERFSAHTPIPGLFEINGINSGSVSKPRPLIGWGFDFNPAHHMKTLAQESLEHLNLQVSPEQLAAFETYAALLEEWNARFSLTAIRDPEGVRIKHFLDSLSCLTVMKEPIGRLIDVGTGAGFPGLVLKIARPDIRLTLVESVGKKTRFCRHVVETLGLQGVNIVTDRAEVLGQSRAHREQYDWAVARALAAMPVLVEYLLPLVRVGGFMLAQKGLSGRDEGVQAANALNILGGRLSGEKEIRLPGVQEPHLLMVIKKECATPPDYPRRTGIPAKNPL